MAVKMEELLRTCELVLERPELLDDDKIGRCVVGLTLSRLLGRELTLDDKPAIPALASELLGLEGEEFERLYYRRLWPERLRERWHEIPARRDWERHPAGHIPGDAEERAARARIAADVVEEFAARAGAVC